MHGLEAAQASDHFHRGSKEAWARAVLDLGSIELRLGRTTEALAGFRRVLELAEEIVLDNPASEGALMRIRSELAIAGAESRMGRKSEAILWQRQVAVDADQCVGQQPTNTALRISLARACRGTSFRCATSRRTRQSPRTGSPTN